MSAILSSSIILQICSLFYIILLLVVYFSKKRLESKENRIYISLMITIFVGLILDILCIFTMVNIESLAFLNEIVTRLYLLYYLVWIIVFTYYIITVSRKKTGSEENKTKWPMTKKISMLLFGIVCVIIVSLPQEYHFTDGGMNSSGLGINIVYGIVGISIAVSFISMVNYVVKNKRDVSVKKYIPLIVFMIVGTISMIIQKYNPTLILIPSVETFVTFLMYFTIENPDLKMINELNVARDQAEKANIAKTDFLSSMSHEIRTPLNAIVGFSQILSESDISEQAKEEVSDIVMASQNLLEIVNGILDISKIEANKLEIINTEYNFKTIFNELASLTKARLGEKPLELRFVYDETIPPVLYGDKTRIKQIALNLLTNAVKYTKEGWVEFKIGSIKKDGVCRIIISVEDSGIGIKPEKIDKLFTKFERLDIERSDTIEGTGLGLAITKKLVNLMGGQIVVQSIFGQGSKFTVAIDQKISNKKVTDTGQLDIIDESKQVIIPSVKVLVVDDNKINLKVAHRFLEKYQCQIEEVDNGQSCLDKISAGEKFDLILLDDMMPRMSGIETLKKLREIPGFNIPTVALTANAISGMREKYLSEGFDEYLPKPLDKKDLDKVIRKFLVED